MLYTRNCAARTTGRARVQRDGVAVAGVITLSAKACCLEQRFDQTHRHARADCSTDMNREGREG